MLNLSQFRIFVVRPTLLHINLWSQVAEDLLIGTALVESNLEYLDQVTHENKIGPAVGVYQIERKTHDDVWENFLKYKDNLRLLVDTTRAPHPEPWIQALTNLAYATAICRVLYFRVKKPLPIAGDLDGMAAYWKQFYNTPLGKGKPEEFVRRYVLHHPK